MKFVFIIDSLKTIGGGSYAQFMFARQLACDGHQVTIFAGDRNFLSEDLDIPNLTVFYRSSIYGRRLTELWADVYEKLRIEPYLKRNRPDWLVGYMRISAIRAVRLGKKFGIPVANFVFETPLWIESGMGKKIEGALKKSWEYTREAYDESDILIPNSELAGNKLLEWLPTANVSAPVYPGVDVSVAEHDGAERDVDVIYVGRLRPHKNVDLILKNVKPSMKVVIIGSGSERENLEALARDRNLDVSFLGAVTDEEKWKQLRKAKLMIFPSSFEGFGMPPLEALASGCHILCSDIPIFREIYGDEVKYVDIDDKDFSSEVHAMLKLKQNGVRSSLLDKYTWKNSAKRIEQILREY